MFKMFNLEAICDELAGLAESPSSGTASPTYVGQEGKFRLVRTPSHYSSVDDLKAYTARDHIVCMQICIFRAYSSIRITI